MLKPTSNVNIRANETARQRDEFVLNAFQASLTAAKVIAKMTKLETTPDAIKTVADAMKTKYYNQYTNHDVVYDATIAPEGTEEKFILEDASAYVDIAQNLPDDVGCVCIEQMELSRDVVRKISIGKQAFIHAHPWKVVDGTLKVLVPYLCAVADIKTGIAHINMGGISYDVPVFEPKDETNALSISDIWIEDKGDAYAKAIACIKSTKEAGTYEITMELGHKAQAAGAVFSINGTPITEEIMCYNLQSNGNMAITSLEVIGANPVSYCWYTVSWENRPFNADEDGVVVHTSKNVVVPGYGRIKFNITATQRKAYA